MKYASFVCAALTAVLPTTAFAQTGTIKSIRLSSGGVAEYVRSLDVGEDGNAVIDVPTDQMDDFLKTLVVSGPAPVRSLSTTGPDMVDETFKVLPITPQDLDSAAGVLRSLRGAPVSANGVKGRIVGVEPASEKQHARLIVMLDSGAFDIAEIGGAMAYKLDDPKDAEMISRAAERLSSDGVQGTRAVTIALEGKASGAIDISYVVATPLWKPSYRILVDAKGKARLQAWAVLENASGEDWHGVSISLTSGKPVTLRQRLYARAWPSRPEVDVANLDIGGAKRNRFGGALANKPLTEAPAPVEAAPAATIAATADEGDVVANFDLPGVYDLKSGETISVPILDREIKAEFVALYREGARHPDAALVLTNDTGTSLPPAVAAVYDEKGRYVGDARVGNVKPGGLEKATFAADQKIEQEVASAITSSFRTVIVKDGYLEATLERRLRKTFSVWGADADRTFVAEDPGMAGWELVKSEGVEETPQGARATVIVPAGKKVSTTIEWRMAESETQAIADIDDTVILQWLDEGPAPEIASKLQGIVTARKAQKEAERDLSTVMQEIEDATSESSRISGMLASVGDTPLKQQFLQDLTEQETSIKALRAQRDEARDRLEKHRKELGEAIARL
ncbi:DUF4139 domain-containing protein [Rhizobium mesosinicum]|uniref:DUF4139 domain-containing protein n=1 Tax=Rhizobium mesosinicum TaxID=335017 RepID=A0ABS7GMQ4_9HYPH|nr:DUF4139 domain-containing protein [Rhizobium mesosinicum]MBW9051240.1 DUF4139 domain-containing protein [Rhizobium mesosinicum]